MSIFDRFIAAVTPPESEEARLKRAPGRPMLLCRETGWTRF